LEIRKKIYIPSVTRKEEGIPRLLFISGIRIRGGGGQLPVFFFFGKVKIALKKKRRDKYKGIYPGTKQQLGIQRKTPRI